MQSLVVTLIDSTQDFNVHSAFIVYSLSRHCNCPLSVVHMGRGCRHG